MVNIDNSTLREMSDHLASAKTRLQAIHMAAYAPTKEEMDAIQQSANDCDETIDLVKVEVEVLLDHGAAA